MTNEPILDKADASAGAEGIAAPLVVSEGPSKEKTSRPASRTGGIPKHMQNGHIFDSIYKILFIDSEEKKIEVSARPSWQEAPSAGDLPRKMPLQMKIMVLILVIDVVGRCVLVLGPA